MMAMAAAIPWGDALDLGQDDLDGEHHLQIGLVNAFGDAASDAREAAAAVMMLEELRDASRLHFQSEEALMARHRYPAREAHADDHRRLLAWLQATGQALDSGDVEVTRALADELRRWLAGHILGADRRLAEFLITVSATV
jgi:hemerythrin-like metal-binding protein